MSTSISILSDGNNYEIIGPKQHEDYRELNIGVDDISVKIESQSIIATFKIKIPNVVIANNSKIYNDRVQRLFDLRNTWKLTLDYYQKAVYFTNMRVFESTIEYETGIKGVEIHVTLHGAVYSALNYIRLNTLEFDKFKGTETLADIVEIILQKSKERIIKHQNLIDTTSDIDIAIDHRKREILHLTNDDSDENEQEIKKLQIEVLELKTLKKDEDALENFQIESIPTFDQMKIIIISEDIEYAAHRVGNGPWKDPRVSSAELSYESTWLKPLKYTGEIKKLTNKDAGDRTTVFAFLEILLREEGFQIIQLPTFGNIKYSPIMIVPLGAISGGRLLNLLSLTDTFQKESIILQ